MSNLVNSIKLLNEPMRPRVNYTLSTNALAITFIPSDFALTARDEARLYVRHRDGKTRYVSGAKNISENSMTFSVPSDFFDGAGSTQGQIRIVRGGNRLYSNLIVFHVHPYYGGGN